jgi:hypothetical protein
MRDDINEEQFFIAHARTENKLPQEKTTIAGIIKELKADKKGDQPSDKFLEIVYLLA